MNNNNELYLSEENKLNDASNYQQWFMKLEAIAYQNDAQGILEGTEAKPNGQAAAKIWDLYCEQLTET